MRALGWLGVTLGGMIAGMAVVAHLVRPDLVPDELRDLGFLVAFETAALLVAVSALIGVKPERENERGPFVF
jgi:hypothetical protein